MSYPYFQIPHPVKKDEFLYFLFDQPHLGKNLRSAFVKYRFELSRETANKLKMDGTRIEGYRYLKFVVEHDKLALNKLCPGLKDSFINLKGTHFDKMRVPHALQVFSNEAAAAIQHLVDNNIILNRQEAMDTSKFIKFTRHWYDIVNNRKPSMALRLDNMEKYNGNNFK
jgi:hypothetical protein